MTYNLDDKTIRELELQANTIRITLIEALIEAGSGHTAGPLGMADIFTYLYFHELRHNPKNPEWPERDRLVLSNGHICPVLYAVLARAGYFPLEEMKTLRKLNSRLQGHPHRTSLPGLETTSGPLGSGLSQAIGMALAAKLDNKKYRIYCLMSDGEHQEGNTWEGAMFAGKNNLYNLTAIMDRNNIQIDGYTEEVMPLEPLVDKYKAFGWHVQHIDGHNIRDFIAAVGHAKSEYGKPSVIIAHTIPGKGVDFMQWDPAWHGKSPKPDEAKKALHELRTLAGKIKSEHE
jgi:transketolase